MPQANSYFGWTAGQLNSASSKVIKLRYSDDDIRKLRAYVAAKALPDFEKSTIRQFLGVDDLLRYMQLDPAPLSKRAKDLLFERVLIRKIGREGPVWSQLPETGGETEPESPSEDFALLPSQLPPPMASATGQSLETASSAARLQLGLGDSSSNATVLQPKDQALPGGSTSDFARHKGQTANEPHTVSVSTQPSESIEREIRTPVSEDAEEMSRRLAELQRENDQRADYLDKSSVATARLDGPQTPMQAKRMYDLPMRFSQVASSHSHQGRRYRPFTRDLFSSPELPNHRDLSASGQQPMTFREDEEDERVSDRTQGEPRAVRGKAKRATSAPAPVTPRKGRSKATKEQKSKSKRKPAPSRDHNDSNNSSSSSNRSNSSESDGGRDDQLAQTPGSSHKHKGKDKNKLSGGVRINIQLQR